MDTAEETMAALMAARSERAKTRMKITKIQESQTEIIKIQMQGIRIQSLHLQETAEVSPRQDRRKRNPSVMYTNGSSHRRKENRL